MQLIDDLRAFTPRFPVIDLHRRRPVHALGPVRPRGARALLRHADRVRAERDAAAHARRPRGGCATVDAKTVSISLDGADRRDARGRARYRGPLRARPRTPCGCCVDEGHTVQINTTVMRRNVEELADVAALARRMGRAHLGGLLPDPRRPRLRARGAHPAGERGRRALPVRRLALRLHRPHRRGAVLPPRGRAARGSSAGRRPRGRPSASAPLYRRLSERLRELLGEPGKSRAQSVGTRDGKGILFVVARRRRLSRRGSCPTGSATCREHDIVELYRDAPIAALDPRARSSAAGAASASSPTPAAGRARGPSRRSGDPLGEDPACAYQPVPAPTGRS